jgi:hypothetical protein
VVFVAERTLFTELMLKLTAPIDFEAMAAAWVIKVNGKTIFPKLPVYLRNYYDEWRRNQLIKEAVARAATKKNALGKLNSRLIPFTQYQSQNESTPTASAAGTYQQQQNQFLNTRVEPVASDDEMGAEILDDTCTVNDTVSWPQPVLPPAMPKAAPLDPVAPCPLHVVGGVQIQRRGRFPVVPLPVLAVRKKGQRGRDSKFRQPRRCKRCVKFGGTNAVECLGGTGQGQSRCQFFTCDGAPIV